MAEVEYLEERGNALLREWLSGLSDDDGRAVLTALRLMVQDALHPVLRDLNEISRMLQEVR